MKGKILEMLRKKEGYISGEQMSQELGVTRSMVWKVIKSLRDSGYQIDSVTNKGYKLASQPDLVTKEELSPYVKTEIFGKKIYDYKEVSSTNMIAKEKAKEGAKEGSLVIAESQTAGKGRLGKTWESPEGTGIWMSLIARPNILTQDVSGMTLIAGLAVCKAIKEITHLPAYIKWPNDIVINGKKVCGILTEMSGEIDRVNHVIIGIGINVNTSQFPKELRKIGTSLKIEGGKDYKRKEIIGQVLMFFEQYYKNYIETKSLLGILTDYKALCITLKNDVKIMNKDESYWAKPVDIDLTGGLMIERENGQKETIRSGEVSVRGIYGYI